MNGLAHAVGSTSSPAFIVRGPCVVRPSGSATPERGQLALPRRPAGRLYISRRTVQANLVHMSAKLDIASRAQLAAQVARHRQ